MILRVCCVTRQLRLCLIDQRSIAREIRFRLLQRGLERSGVDHKKLVALLHDIALVKKGLLQLSGDL